VCVEDRIDSYRRNPPSLTTIKLDNCHFGISLALKACPGASLTFWLCLVCFQRWLATKADGSALLSFTAFNAPASTVVAGFGSSADPNHWSDLYRYYRRGNTDTIIQWYGKVDSISGAKMDDSAEDETHHDVAGQDRLSGLPLTRLGRVIVIVFDVNSFNYPKITLLPSNLLGLTVQLSNPATRSV
jgi:hypothetical protein